MGKIRLQKMVEDTKKFFTSPVELYQNFEKEGGYLEPVVYTVLMSLIGEIILIFFLMLFHLKLSYFTFSILICIMFIPLILISFFISSLISHLIWTALGSKESFETSLRCNASFTALLPAGILVSIVPFFGKWIGGFAYLFALYFYIITASIYVHKIDEQKAKKVFLIIFVVLALLHFVNLTTAEIKTVRTKKMMKKIEEDYQRQMEEYEKYERMMQEQQQKMYEEYQKQMQQNQIPQEYPSSQ